MILLEINRVRDAGPWALVATGTLGDLGAYADLDLVPAGAVRAAVAALPALDVRAAAAGRLDHRLWDLLRLRPSRTERPERGISLVGEDGSTLLFLLAEDG